MSKTWHTSHTSTKITVWVQKAILRSRYFYFLYPRLSICLLEENVIRQPIYQQDKLDEWLKHAEESHSRASQINHSFMRPDVNMWPSRDDKGGRPVGRSIVIGQFSLCFSPDHLFKKLNIPHTIHVMQRKWAFYWHRHNVTRQGVMTAQSINGNK